MAVGSDSWAVASTFSRASGDIIYFIASSFAANAFTFLTVLRQKVTKPAQTGSAVALLVSVDDDSDEKGEFMRRLAVPDHDLVVDDAFLVARCGQWASVDVG